jgi:hypothetical protein
MSFPARKGGFSMSNLYPIDPIEFHAFLQAQASTSVVGIACDDAKCPLARFLNAHYDGSTFVVNRSEYRRLGDDVSLGLDCDDVYDLPEFAQDFVMLVDRASGYLNGMLVYVGDALSLLQEACDGQGVPLTEVQHG